MNLDWTTRPPRDGKTVITAIDTHAAGEPLRIITGSAAEESAADPESGTISRRLTVTVSESPCRD